MTKEIFPKRLTKKELGYLVGLSVGDGYSNYNKNKNSFMEKRGNLQREVLYMEFKNKYRLQKFTS